MAFELLRQPRWKIHLGPMILVVLVFPRTGGGGGTVFFSRRQSLSADSLILKSQGTLVRLGVKTSDGSRSFARCRDRLRPLAQLPAAQPPGLLRLERSCLAPLRPAALMSPSSCCLSWCTTSTRSLSSWNFHRSDRRIGVQPRNWPNLVWFRSHSK